MIERGGSTSQAAVSPWQQSAAVNATEAAVAPAAQARPGTQEPSDQSRAGDPTHESQPDAEAGNGSPEAGAPPGLQQEGDHAEQPACKAAGHTQQQAASSQPQQQSGARHGQAEASATGEAGMHGPNGRPWGRNPPSGPFSAQLPQASGGAGGSRHGASEEGGNPSSHGSQKMLSFAESTLDKQVS